MFDHLTITVADYTKSRDFYQKLLESLGMKLLYEEDGVVAGFGADRPIFWVSAPDDEHPVSANVHIAFRCDARERVDAFYKAALAAGGRDNGQPGKRPEYHKDYYAAYIIDPDGNNIEAVYGNS